MSRSLRKTCCVLALCILVHSVSVKALDGAGTPADWLRHPVRYALENKDMALFLREFCARQGAVCRVSDNVAGSLSGHFVFENPADFLALLCKTHGLVWCYDGQAVHFYNVDEQDARLFRLQRLTPDRLRETLVAMGLWDDRFPWRQIESEGLVYLIAPPRYLDIVESVVAQVETLRERDRIMEVFRLEHAWADDQTVTLRDEDVSVPGVATLLRDMILSGGVPSVGQEAGGRASMAGLMGTGLVGEERAAEKSASAAPPAKEGQAPGISILADPRLNAVIVWDVRERMPFYRELIEKLDQPVELVEIRAAIVDVEINRSHELGIRWGYRRTPDSNKNPRVSASGGINKASIDESSDILSTIGDGLNLTTIYTSGIDELMMRIRALEEDGAANVLSRPSVLTVDNVQAELRHTETFYVKLQGKEEVDLVDVSSGTVLQVTPHIVVGRDGKRVKLFVYVEDGSDTSNSDDEVDNLPRVRKSTITTRAEVREGQALVIGGYYYEHNRASDSGVPGLKNIPIAGRLFKSEKVDCSKVERLFILAPRVVNLDQVDPSLPPATADVLERRGPWEKAFQWPACEAPGALCGKNSCSPTAAPVADRKPAAEVLTPDVFAPDGIDEP